MRHRADLLGLYPLEGQQATVFNNDNANSRWPAFQIEFGHAQPVAEHFAALPDVGRISV
jgi:hypothetical protein